MPRGFIVEQVRKEGRMGALEEVKDLAEAVTRRRALRLWDVEMGGQPGRAIVRVFVDADDGVDLDTVAEVSEEISRGLDLRDPIQGRYMLEVSSPGLERNLRRPEHFRVSTGRQVVVKTVSKLVSDSNRLEGTIVAADEREVRLDLGDEQVAVPYEQVKSARTVFEWGTT
jgi:ribosome maturation factor RimP